MSAIRNIIAIDPGLDGAWCIMNEDGENAGTPLACPLPTMGEGAQRVINGPELYRILCVVPKARAIIEAAQPMPKQGVSSVFRYGRAFGTIVGIVAALDIPTEYVSPAKWKRDLGLGSDKELCRRRAIELFPASAEQFARKKDHHRAEAALIAHWAGSRA